MPLDPPRAYRILGLGPGASPDEVKTAYRDLVQVWHPDRFPENSRLRDKAQRNLQRINDAYAVLKDYAPPAMAPRRSLRESISAVLDLGDLRESAPFRAPAAALRRSLKILRIDTDLDIPPSRRNLWAFILIAVAAVVGAVAWFFPQ